MSSSVSNDLSRADNSGKNTNIDRRGSVISISHLDFFQLGFAIEEKLFYKSEDFCRVYCYGFGFLFHFVTSKTSLSMNSPNCLHHNL